MTGMDVNVQTPDKEKGLAPFGDELLLHPVVLVRLAGEPADTMKTLGSGETAQALARITEFKSQLQQEIAGVCDALADCIPAAYAARPDSAKSMLQLKRDLYNLRSSRVSLADIAPSLTDEVRGRIELAHAAIDRLQAMQAACFQAYAQELDSARRAMANVLDRKNLRQGLVYSDPELLGELDTVLRRQAPVKKKKRKDLEHTFLNYVQRTSLKTSPMSAFTPVLEGAWQTGAGTLQRSYPAWRLRTQTALRKGLVHAFVAPLLRKLPNADQAFRLNPGLRGTETGHSLVHLSPWLAFWGAPMVHKQIKRWPVLQAVSDMFNAVGGAALHYGDIVRRLAAYLPPQTHAGIPDLVERLIDHSLLVIDVTFGEQEDSAAWADRLLSTLPGEQAAVVRRGLGTLTEDVRRHAAADDDARPATRAAINATLRNLQDDSECADPQHMTPVFYENCVFQDEAARFDPELLTPVRESITQLLRLSPILDTYHRFQSTLADKFVAQFGEDGCCDDVLGFLHAAPDPVAWQSVHVNEARQDLDGRLAALQTDFNDFLYAKYLEGGDIVLAPQDLDRFIGRIPSPIKARTVSYSFHAQFIDCRTADRGMVLNKVYPGNSIMFSRFLAQDDHCRPEIYDYLCELANGAVCLEVPGTFGMNTNVHPPMTRAELGLPPFAPNRLHTPQVPIASLTLRYDRTRHRLQMHDRNGQRYDPLFFGMCVPHVRPRIHRVLSAMSTQSAFSLEHQVMKTVLERTVDFDAGQVLRIPRLSVGRLVVGRRSIHIPAEHFPQQQDSEEDFFFAVQRWCERLALPRDAFVRLVEAPLRSAAAGMPPAARADKKPGRSKPFYVDFTNPVLVQLLQRALRSRPARLTLHEMLPAADDQWLEIERRKHVAEVQFEASIRGAM